jgi:FtsZ-binding cell division protein ZapB
MDKKKRQWAEKEMVLIDKADNLRNELNKLKASKAEDDETSRRAVDAAKGTIGELEVCIVQLKEGKNRRKHELETATQDLDDARRRNKSIHQEHKEVLDRFEESKQATLQEMQTKHQIELEKVQQEAIDDVRRALIDKNAVSEEKEGLEKDVATLRSKVSSVKDELEECRNRTSTNDDIVERLKSENTSLQDTVTILRSEMETRNGVSREDELSQRVEELSDELDVVLEDRRRLIDLSNKLRVDLQRLQSSSRQSSSSVDGNAQRQPESHEGVLSTQPLSLHNIIDAEAAGASSTAKRQGTVSQRQAFARLRKKKDQQQQQERIKVRNWNERDDNR